MVNWDKLLFERWRYRSVFARLKKKARSEVRYLGSFALHEELSLYWTILNQRRVVAEIFRMLRSPSPHFSTQKLSLVRTDKLRDFYVADWPERILLMVVADILREVLDPQISSRVYSFRKGTGTHKALQDVSCFIKAKGAKGLFVLRRDIKSYGDTIPHEKLFSLLRESQGLDSSRIFFPLVVGAIRVAYRNPGESGEACLHVGIPSGSPLVPQLENFYLSSLDARLEDLPQSFYGRYGDDFIFATPSYEEAKKAESIIDETVKELGLTIKAEKKENGYLTHNTAKGYHAYPEFPGMVRFEWLGASVLARGPIGCKKSHFVPTRAHLLEEVRQLVKRVGLLDCPTEVKERTISKALHELLSPYQNYGYAHVLYSNQNDQIAKYFDKKITQTLVRSINLYWGLGKKESWKTFRRLHTPSVFHLKMKKFNRKSKVAA